MWECRLGANRFAAGRRSHRSPCTETALLGALSQALPAFELDSAAAGLYHSRSPEPSLPQRHPTPPDSSPAPNYRRTA